MNHPLMDQVKIEFDHAIDFLKHEYSSLQVGRANPVLVEGLTVDAYGASTPLKGLASISTPDTKTIQIQPWDKNLLSAIEKTILSSDLGFNPQNDGQVIRINIPELTEERRIELKKIVHKLAEDGKISLRNARHKVHNEFKVLKDSSEITEDDFFSYDKTLQEIIKEHTDTIDKLCKEKEEDIMKI